MVETKSLKIPGHGRADIGQVGQGVELIPADFGRIHEDSRRRIS